MFDLYPTYEQKEFAYYLTSNGEFGNRGKADGTIDQQFTGILTQIVFGDLFNYKRPEKKKGWDGGYDFIITENGKEYRADIKARGSHYDMQSHYVHNFIGYQKDYNCDIYIFANYNVNKDKIQICGAVSKYELMTTAKFYKKGETRTRDDGTTFIAKAPLFEIKQSELNYMQDESDIFYILEREIKRREQHEELKKQYAEIPKIEMKLDKNDWIPYLRQLYNMICWKPNIQQLIFVYREVWRKKKVSDESLIAYFSVKRNQDRLLDIVNWELWKAETNESEERKKMAKSKE